MPHKFDPAHCARLESPERLALLPVETIVGLLGVRPGDHVLDAGCGPGVFTVPLARAVGAGGRVLAIDLAPEMVEACRHRVEREGLANVEVRRSGESAIPAEAGSVDLVFACHLLHELEEPARFLAEVRRVLRPAGRLAAVEWERRETAGIGPPVEHRLAPDAARAMLEGHGLRVTEVRSVTWANYAVLAAPAGGAQAGRAGRGCST